MNDLSLDDVITSLTILRERMKENQIPFGRFDEMKFTIQTIKLKKGSKTLTIPLMVASAVAAGE